MKKKSVNLSELILDVVLFRHKLTTRLLGMIRRQVFQQSRCISSRPVPYQFFHVHLLVILYRVLIPFQLLPNLLQFWTLETHHLFPRHLNHVVPLAQYFALAPLRTQYRHRILLGPLFLCGFLQPARRTVFVVQTLLAQVNF